MTMKDYTIAQFQKILSTYHSPEKKDWTRESTCDTYGDNIHHLEDTPPIFFGGVTVTNTHKETGAKLIYTEGWQYQEYNPNSFEVSIDGIENVWTFNFNVINEDNEQLDTEEIEELLEEYYCFKADSSDYSDLLAEIQESSTQALDTQESEPSNEGLNLLTIYRDNKPNFQFFGQLIAGVSNYNYSQKNDRWIELYLYKTQSGLYVCAQENHTCWQGENNRYKAETAKNIEEIQDFFGYTDLSKELYEEANIDATIKI